MSNHLFQKKLTVMPTDKGFAVAVYGVPSGQVFASLELAEKEIDAIKERAKAKAQKRQLDSRIAKKELSNQLNEN